MWSGSRKVVKVVGWSFGVLSIIFLVVSFFTFLGTRRFVNSAARAEGTVVKLVERHDNGGTTFRPVFVFRDSNDCEHEIFSTVGTYPPTHKVGEKVSVLYDSEKPQNAALDGFFDLWLLPLVFGLIGVVQMIGSVVCLLVVPKFLGKNSNSQVVIANRS
jgi:hypothetical protein